MRRTPGTERALARTAVRYELLTVALVIPEAAASLWLGVTAGSVALVAFGMDSVAETLSGMVVGWRMWTQAAGRAARRVRRVEAAAAKASGTLLLVVAVWVVADACRRLLGFGAPPRASPAGALLMVASFAVMLALGRAKLTVARSMRSRAMQADAYQSIVCAWLAFKALAGLLLNLAFGWWWADPLAGLVIVPLMIREGREALRGGEED